MTIYYPQDLPRGLHSGRTYQLVSPLMRSELASGRARQRRRFTSVPEGASVSWLFNSAQSNAFIAWWRDMLVDGVNWFQCPLAHPLGYGEYQCRFIDVYRGPNRVGPDLWSFSAELELFERAAFPVGAGEFPEFIADAGIFDRALNEYWPLSLWQIYAANFDTAINEDWPQP